MGSASLNYKLTHAPRIKTQWNFISAENCRDSEENVTKLLSKSINIKVSDYRLESWRLHVKFVSAWLCNFDIITNQFPLTIETNLVAIPMKQKRKKLIWLFIQHQFSTSEKASFYAPEKCENNYQS